MPKHKRQKISFDGDWKPVASSEAFVLENGDNFPWADLVQIEELTDYHCDFPKKKGKKPADEPLAETSKKRKDRADKVREKRKLAKRRKTDDSQEVITSTKEDTADPESRAASIAEQEVLTSDEKKARKKSVKHRKAGKPEDPAKDLDEVPQELVELPGESADPVDISKWEQLQVSDFILKALGDLNFTAPTPIQESCLPFALRSRKDIVGAAETGSGKTLAFAIPIVQNIIEDKAAEEPKDDVEGSLRALIITPTRELAVQINNHIQSITKYVSVSTCLILGGMFKEKQDRLLRRCPDIIIATPGRLYEHIQSRSPYLQDLSHVRYLVIDEADRMVEKGHFKELADIMQRLNENPRVLAKRQNFLFSATLCSNLMKSEKPHKKARKDSEPDADKVTNLAALIGLKNSAKLVDLSKPEGTAGGLVERRMPCSLKEKDYHLYYLLMTEATGRTVVFCNSLDCVRRLYGVFSYLLTETGRPPLILHAGMHQKQRLKNLEKFHSNAKGVLLASDVASRGLDIPDVQFVIHYQVPRNTDLYVHRSGRTARAFKVGCSVLLVDPSDVAAYNKILRSLHRDRDFSLVEVEAKLMRFAKERVDLARRIDAVEHVLRKEASKDEWYLKAAEESELILDDDDVKLLDIQAGSKRNTKSREAKFLKKQLQLMLAVPLKPNMPGFSRKYPSLNFTRKRLGLD